MTKAEAIWTIDERIDGMCADLRVYIYIRKENLQHGDDNLGGGNMTQATALFAALNFLGKIQYCLDKDCVLPSSTTGDINEEHAFIHLVKKLDAEGINLGLPPKDTSALELVWRGFRNKLAHVSSVEDGKQVMTHTFAKPLSTNTVNEILDYLRKEIAFAHDGNNRNWKVNVDVLLAKLPEIQKLITRQIHEKDSKINYEVLKEVIG